MLILPLVSHKLCCLRLFKISGRNCEPKTKDPGFESPIFVAILVPMSQDYGVSQGICNVCCRYWMGALC